MPDITISEFAEALRRELRADMRVHRTRMNTALRDFKDEVSEKIDEHTESQVRVEATLGELTAAVNRLIQKDVAETAARERRASTVRRFATFVNSTPGMIATASSVAGTAAAAFAVFH